MRFILIILSTLIFTTACVTSETTINGDKTKTKFDPVGAAENRVKLALLYIKENQMQQAKENLDKALEYQPNSAKIYRMYGYYYQKVNEIEKARTAYKKSLSLDAKNGDTYHNYATFLCSIGEYDEAEQAFLDAIKTPRYPRVSNSYFNAAICEEKRGDKKKAVYYFGYSLSHDPLNYRINLSLARLNIDLKNYKEAKRNLFTFQRSSKQTAESLWQWIRLSYVTGKDASFKKYSAQLLEQFPESQQALNYANHEYYEQEK